MGNKGEQDMPHGVDRSVLFVLGELTYSGVEKMLEASAGLWQRAGFQPHILSIGQRPGDFSSRLQDCGYTIHQIRFSRSPIFLATLAGFYRQHPYDIVHIHTEQAAFWHALLARVAQPDARLVRTVHAIFAFAGLLRMRRLLQRWFMRHLLAVTFTAPGASVADHEKAVFFNKTQVLENWIKFVPPVSAAWREEARNTLGVDRDCFIVSSIGNCDPVKNHKALLQALAMLPRDRPWRYLHVGSSEEEQDEIRLASELGIADRCSFLGRRPATDILAATDIFVMPSRFEGFGIAAAEALAMGLPCILSDAPGLRDFSGFGEAITWCDPYSPPTITAAIIACMQKPRRFPVIAEKVRADFATEAGVRRFVSLYAKLLRYASR